MQSAVYVRTHVATEHVLSKLHTRMHILCEGNKKLQLVKSIRQQHSEMFTIYSLHTAEFFNSCTATILT
jgi:hypothetical protein